VRNVRQIHRGSRTPLSLQVYRTMGTRRPKPQRKAWTRNLSSGERLIWVTRYLVAPF